MARTADFKTTRFRKLRPLVIVFFSLLGFVAINVRSLPRLLNSYHERNNLRDRVEAKKAEVKDLERQKRWLEQGKTEEWLRKSFPGLVRDGERLIRLRKSDEKPTSSTSSRDQKNVDTTGSDAR